MKHIKNLKIFNLNTKIVMEIEATVFDTPIFIQAETIVPQRKKWAEQWR